ncbi:hypothetical protein J3Q64DRAFT_1774825 [Phycomyces blakesleeanus]|uniref:Uncharacterized protein n=2 Tax=Phycomyces blakesleeanus TaxID=4837 RepID=A0A162T5E6_PHYB8|nr:hypothetical protein PHYBLDRAFT_70853 [Phycomyces blakesleeanus NRRL 1555(-)]OAD66392.1 hypothetical protein PHYBLDRAFT_70853 [Phycomyces blakesleeanus NRRL 1555(-)]|eukprot:XP_018284432.1 hypothetical protein PHYBLDRAFT_70853 [Phycomyces blakesleeanus NRRL 1555(-)]
MSRQDPTLDIVKERVKQYNLTDEEKLAIDTSRKQLSTRTSFGGFTGAAAAFYLSRRRQFSPLRSIFLVGGGFFLGSQLGFIAGITAGMNTINKLPNPDRLKNLVIDVQNEVMASRGYTRDSPTSRPRPMTPEERQNHTRVPGPGLEEPQNELNREFGGSVGGPRGDVFWDEEKKNDKNYDKNNSNNIDSFDEVQGLRKESTVSAWDKVRAEHAPTDNSWAKLRKESQQEEGYQSQSQRQRQQSEYDNFRNDDLSKGELFREGLEAGKSAKTNAWGDRM